MPEYDIRPDGKIERKRTTPPPPPPPPPTPTWRYGGTSWSEPRTYNTNLGSKFFAIFLPILAFLIGQIVQYIVYDKNGTVLLFDLIFPRVPKAVLIVSTILGVVSIVHISVRSWKWADDDDLLQCWLYILFASAMFGAAPCLASFLGFVLTSVISGFSVNGDDDLFEDGHKVASVFLPIITFIVGQIVQYAVYNSTGKVLLLDLIIPKVPKLVLIISSLCGIIAVIRSCIDAWQWADDGYDDVYKCWVYLIVFGLLYAVVPSLAGFVGIIMAIVVPWSKAEYEEEWIIYVTVFLSFVVGQAIMWSQYARTDNILIISDVVEKFNFEKISAKGVGIVLSILLGINTFAFCGAYELDDDFAPKCISIIIYSLSVLIAPAASTVLLIIYVIVLYVKDGDGVKGFSIATSIVLPVILLVTGLIFNAIASTYTITFDLQGGYGNLQSVEVRYNKDMPEVEVPYRTGYLFLGFYDSPVGVDDEDGVICYYHSNMESASKWDKKEDATLYARWQAKDYNITLDRQGGTGGSSDIKVTFDKAMPYASKPSRAGYNFYGYYTKQNGQGVCYYNSSMTSQRNWDIDQNTTLYAYWKVSAISASAQTSSLSNIDSSASTTINVYGGSGSYSYSIIDKGSGINCSMSGNVLTVSRTSYSASGTIKIKITDNITGATTTCNVSYSTIAEPVQSGGGGGSCVAKGTEILLANGNTALIENIAVGDKILTFDHANGNYTESTVAFTYYANSLVKIIRLNFTDDVSIELLNTGHGLYNITLDRYVLITPNNVDEYVGHKFAYSSYIRGEFVLSEVELISYSIDEDSVERYDIVTENNLNHIANGLLACSDTLVGVSNVFEFNNLLYNVEQVIKDIEQYGLYSYEEWSEYVTKEEFEAFNGAYFKIAIEKGLLTMEELFALINDLKTQWN